MAKEPFLTKCSKTLLPDQRALFRVRVLGVLPQLSLIGKLLHQAYQILLCKNQRNKHYKAYSKKTFETDYQEMSEEVG